MSRELSRRHFRRFNLQWKIFLPQMNQFDILIGNFSQLRSLSNGGGEMNKYIIKSRLSHAWQRRRSSASKQSNQSRRVMLHNFSHSLSRATSTIERKNLKFNCILQTTLYFHSFALLSTIALQFRLREFNFCDKESCTCYLGDRRC